MGWLDNLDLPSLNGQPGKPVPKGESRLERDTRDDRAELKAEETWKKAVRTRDELHCRWCHRRVKAIPDHKPERAECHHISGRVVKAIRWDVRNGLLLCLTCHERVTGKVNERFVVVSTKTFRVDGIAYINGNKLVEFKKVTA